MGVFHASDQLSSMKILKNLINLEVIFWLKWNFRSLSVVLLLHSQRVSENKQYRLYRQKKRGQKSMKYNWKFKYKHAFKETLECFLKAQTTMKNIVSPFHFTTLCLTLLLSSSTYHACFLSASHQSVVI